MDNESDGFETELDAYRDRAEKPLWRLFKRYGHGERHWLAVGLVTSVFAYAALLVTRWKRCYTPGRDSVTPSRHNQGSRRRYS